MRCPAKNSFFELSLMDIGYAVLDDSVNNFGLILKPIIVKKNVLRYI